MKLKAVFFLTMICSFELLVGCEPGETPAYNPEITEEPTAPPPSPKTRTKYKSKPAEPKPSAAVTQSSHAASGTPFAQIIFNPPPPATTKVDQSPKSRRKIKPLPKPKKKTKQDEASGDFVTRYVKDRELPSDRAKSLEKDLRHLGVLLYEHLLYYWEIAEKPLLKRRQTIAQLRFTLLKFFNEDWAFLENILDNEITKEKLKELYFKLPVNQNGDTVVHACITQRDLSLVPFLEKYGADVEHPNSKGEKPRQIIYGMHSRAKKSSTSTSETRALQRRYVQHRALLTRRSKN